MAKLLTKSTIGEKFNFPWAGKKIYITSSDNKMVFFKCPSFFRPVFQGKVLGRKALLVWESKFSKSSSFDNEAALTRVVAVAIEDTVEPVIDAEGDGRKWDIYKKQ